MIAAFASFAMFGHPEATIDRRALVARHEVVVRDFSARSPLQVGNGEFAFNVDATGLQTFVPFNTLSHWGWHSSPLPAGERIENFDGQAWETGGRMVRYPMPDPKHPALSSWMASNSHRINLGRIGLLLEKKDGSTVAPEDLRSVDQTLDLWSGVIRSRFTLQGVPVSIKTACHPKSDSVAVQIESQLVSEGRLKVFFAAPGDDPKQFADNVGDWANPAPLTLRNRDKNGAELMHKLGDISFFMGVAWSGDAEIGLAKESDEPKLDILMAQYGTEGKWVDVTSKVAAVVAGGRLDVRVSNDLAPDPAPGLPKRLRVTYTLGSMAQIVESKENEMLSIVPSSERNRAILRPRGGTTLEFTCTFSKGKAAATLPNAKESIGASRRSWESYWRNGGVVDLSGSQDPRWKELERRIVLSQYLMAVNSAGSLPPQESGLLNNGWFGRFHMEMYWWHAAHWAIWNRWPQIERSLGIYRKLLPSAKALAKSQGYAGARWPKCLGPEGREWPHEIHALLAWQQPHPLFLAELEYRARPTQATLEKWWPVVEATADFMATYPQRHTSGRYDLGAPIHLASENTDPKSTRNPTFELTYWRFGLKVALNWSKRMGKPANPKWREVLGGLALLPVEDGKYVLFEGVPNMWSAYNFEHPALTATYGMLPGDGVDVPTMGRTLDKIESTWRFDHTWGWDFPMLAMCAARLGRPDQAIDFLLTKYPGFLFDERGLATGGPFPYFPSNGALLYAVGMMAAGWDGAPSGAAPGFPRNGRWKVRAEGLSQVP